MFLPSPIRCKVSEAHIAHLNILCQFLTSNCIFMSPLVSHQMPLITCIVRESEGKTVRLKALDPPLNAGVSFSCFVLSCFIYIFLCISLIIVFSIYIYMKVRSTFIIIIYIFIYNYLYIEIHK